MSGKYLLDTNIIIALFNGDRSIPPKLDASELVCISVVVIGELLYGAKKSQHIKENIEKVKKFLSRCSVFSINEETAEGYSTIKTGLTKKGCPIPENDIWVAATVLQHELILVSRDEHFNMIPKLLIEQW
jgi:tRNA(fMet)-specific endonuclease VapC